MSIEAGKILSVDLEDEMQKSYIDYAMSVIVGRALPDVRDGLKPVHRRILYGMLEGGMTPDKPHKKSARVVGDVMARYHPHGDAAIYDSVVRMAQDFSSRYPLVDGQGNFGSVDGDAPAAMRYTEVRLTPLAMEMLADIDKETVDFAPNYDGSTEEPVVLPAGVPNLLINGSAGIAVGMATNIPPHNLGEVVDALMYRIDSPDCRLEEVMRLIPGPDFPTGAMIIGKEGISRAYASGRGSITVRARAGIEPMSAGRHRIVVDEIPFQVNKASLIEKIASLVQEKKIEGITDVRDESDRHGLRIVIELRRDAHPRTVLNQLYKHTQLQDTFGVIMLALVNGRPRVLNLLQVLDAYLGHRQEVVTRRTKYLRDKAQERIHIVAGLLLALDRLDAVIDTIRRSPDVDTARQNLMSGFDFSEKQAQAILDMRLARLTGLEREKLEQEHAELTDKIAYYEKILGDAGMLGQVIKDELLRVKEKYADARRTEIVAAAGELREADLVPDAEVVVTLTRKGYIKRMPVAVYHSQRRGGKGILGLTTREDDFVSHLLVTSNHQWLLLFTDRGKVYRLHVYDLPEEGRQAKGLPLINMLPVAAEEWVTAVVAIRDFEADAYLCMATARGQVKRTPLVEFDTARRDGIIALTLDADDRLVGVRLTEGKDELMLGTKAGLAIRFAEFEVRSMGRQARGVRGISLAPGDEVISLATAREGTDVLALTANGHGKRTPVAEYRLQARGGKGIKTFHLGKRTGPLVDLLVVREEDEIFLLSSEGSIIRVAVNDISRQGRVTQGVIVMRMGEGERIVAVARG
ncbi:MAG: DNA gyrase subunit A [Clostridia bacterium]|nr:MAG: DNA gyrase subunit A [Clostridia bacterium]